LHIIQLFIVAVFGKKFLVPAAFYNFALVEHADFIRIPDCGKTVRNGNRGARVTEVDPETQDVVFELELEDAIYQRVYRMSLYPENQ
jgi:arylsulfate sulfotransferase